MIDPSIESVPDQEKAAYLLENGDSLMVWNGESGWEYEFFDTSLEPVIGHRARGVTSLSEAMHLAMEQMNYTGLSFTAKDCDEFFALVKRSLETGYPPIVFPFLDREQVIINDVDVEAFRAVMQPEYDRMVAEDGVTEGFIGQLQELVAEYDAANAA